MKAIIMAGGEGVRLRPITSDRPKPMVPLLDVPVIEHIVLLLKKNNITDICVTLRYMPQAVISHLGDGNQYGVSIQYRTEDKPLGTAGGVRACSDFLGKDDFLIISGDCVCDFDLNACVDFHKKSGAEATIVLYSHPEPPEYGLVVTDSDGQIKRFCEKPAWNSVFTDTINTGIYILSHGVLETIPENQPCDFGKDLFPKLLSEKRKLYGVRAEGYWCDIGSPEAFLQCTSDALDGAFPVYISAEKAGDGLYSASPIPDAVEITPPVYIGRGVTLSPGAKIGPYAVIGSESSIGVGAIVRDSIIDGAYLQEDSSTLGAIVCRGSSVGRGSLVLEGAIIGSGTVIGSRCSLSQRAKVWPGRKIPDGSSVTGNVISGSLRGDLTFSESSAITGEFNITVTPESCFTLGAASARYKRIGISRSGGEGARILSEAFACGVCATGGDVLLSDAPFESCAAFAAEYFALPLSVFVRQSGDEITLVFFGAYGKPLTRSEERTLEAASSGNFNRANGAGAGSSSRVSGTAEAYAAAAAKCALPNAGKAQHSGKFTVGVTGSGMEKEVLKSALELCGYVICEKRQGVPVFHLEKGGKSLSAWDEDGRFLDSEHLLVMTALIEFENGEGIVAVPYSAPATLDVLAGSLGGRVLRLGLDGAGSDELYLRQLHMRDAVAAAVRICSALLATSETLSALSSRSPSFTSVVREIRLHRDRGGIMHSLTDECSGISAVELLDGLRVKTARGRIDISPLRTSDVLRIRAEGASSEIAEELCGDFERLALKYDS